MWSISYVVSSSVMKAGLFATGAGAQTSSCVTSFHQSNCQLITVQCEWPSNCTSPACSDSDVMMELSEDDESSEDEDEDEDSLSDNDVTMQVQCHLILIISWLNIYQ